MFEYVGPPMTRDTLASLLIAKGVAERAYHLYGAHTDDAFVLDHRREGWVVFYTERGNESVLKLHACEADACTDLLNRVLADDHNLFALVAGPSPPDQADQGFATWLRDHRMSQANMRPGDYKRDDVTWAAGEPTYRRYFVRTTAIRAATQ